MGLRVQIYLFLAYVANIAQEITPFVGNFSAERGCLSRFRALANTKQRPTKSFADRYDLFALRLAASLRNGVPNICRRARVEVGPQGT